MTIDTLDWKGLAKKNGMELGDIITEFKIENLDRPSKAIVYPFALILWYFAIGLFLIFLLMLYHLPLIILFLLIYYLFSFIIHKTKTK